MSSNIREEIFSNWNNREAYAEKMIPIIGDLFRERNIVTSIYGRPIVNRSSIAILKAHRFVRQVEKKELIIEDTFPILEALSKMDLHSIRVDIGKLAVQYAESGRSLSVEDFVKDAVKDVIGVQSQEPMKTQDVVLYGFGRIGRLLARILVEKAGPGFPLRLRAVVIRATGRDDDLDKRASLLRRDSVHGSFKGTITIDRENEAIVANGTYINVIYSNAPDQIDYTQYGIENAVVIDNTGMWRDEEGLGLHLKSKGASKVILTAPGKGDIKNVVFGVNQGLISNDDNILSAASCTTNAIVPVLKCINDKFGIECGHVETVHAYTNDQNLIDNYHKGSRRGRAAALNMVLTETGAAKAVAKALPELDGKLTGNAIRVPTPNVSMAILNLTLDKESSKDELNAYIREMSLHSSLKKQIDYVHSPEAVSSDFVGSRFACVFDAEATIVSGNRAVLYVWYDNEFGYSCQVIRMLQYVAGVDWPTIPA